MNNLAYFRSDWYRKSSDIDREGFHSATLMATCLIGAVLLIYNACVGSISTSVLSWLACYVLCFVCNVASYKFKMPINFVKIAFYSINIVGWLVNYVGMVFRWLMNYVSIAFNFFAEIVSRPDVDDISEETVKSTNETLKECEGFANSKDT